jgi:hypothetical protein
LLHGNLDREFQRSPAEIENLLTSVVFGSCQYVSPGDALLRFLSEACDVHGTRLGPLTGVTSASYEFWPSWSGEPDVVVKLDREAGPAWILIEAKLRNGKSSLPTTDGPVKDQLGKYWVELKSRAAAAGAVPLAVVYVTLGVTLPDVDFRVTQDELALKEPSAAPAPLYWLSWRDFATVVNDGSPQVLRDVSTLLHRWHIVHAKMGVWPDAPPFLSPASFPNWTFTSAWGWPQPPTGRIEWQFFA